MSNPKTLDEAIRLFKGYVLDENGFDELDFKEWLIDWSRKQAEMVVGEDDEPRNTLEHSRRNFLRLEQRARIK